MISGLTPDKRSIAAGAQLAIRGLALCVGLACLVSCGSSSDQKEGAAPIARAPGPLIGELLDSLRARNGRLETAQILSVQAIPWSTSRLAFLVRGAAPGDFDGKFEDELFGVFIVDSSLTHVVRVVDTIPTRRWHDYEVGFDRVGRDSLYVVGSGATYGDEGMRRAYDWDSLAH